MPINLKEEEEHYVEYEFHNRKHNDSERHDAEIRIKSTRRMTFEECILAFQVYLEELLEDDENQSEMFEKELN